jgi:hypothetical protein
VRFDESLEVLGLYTNDSADTDDGDLSAINPTAESRKRDVRALGGFLGGKKN